MVCSSCLVVVEGDVHKCAIMRALEVSMNPRNQWLSLHFTSPAVEEKMSKAC